MTEIEPTDHPIANLVTGGSDWESPATDPNDETFGDVVVGISPERADDSTLAGHDVVLLGEPFDAAVIGRRGAADGPDAIRESLAGLKRHRFGSSTDATDATAAIGDLGNVAVDHGTVNSDDERDAIRSAVESVTGRLHRSEAVPIVLGGDNSLTVPNVMPLLSETDADETVGVCNLDAHLDVREVQEKYTSGTPYRELLEAGLDVYVVAGARDFETAAKYAEFVDDHDGTVVTADELGHRPAAARDRIRTAIADVDHLYVSVDCDVLDATAAPGVSAPTPGGLTSRELFALIDSLVADPRLRGFEIVECAPPLDSGGRTVDTVARAVARVLHAVTGSADTESGGVGR
ncbi:formimidoylglutamase [Halorubrum vacuolatum]|uniref:Formimidoylglutamase n=1 Tax=Halorubrum vacuolatum TaxID=63740 RepID=A0A238VST0_HALVU|nr:formimidoylglutamase [Halorubrum vacuolatum]SNR37214.1 formiminoglutamase [Halorubrum vacuolatum]